MDEKEEKNHRVQGVRQPPGWSGSRADTSHFTRVQQWTQNSPWVSLVPNARLSVSVFGLAWGPRAHKRRYGDTVCSPYQGALSGKVSKVYILVLAQRILFCILPWASALRNKIPLSQQNHQSYLSRASADHSQLSTLFSCLYVFVINSSSCFVCFSLNAFIHGEVFACTIIVFLIFNVYMPFHPGNRLTWQRLPLVMWTVPGFSLQ